jgi:DegV family protein with EDD domain
MIRIISDTTSGIPVSKAAELGISYLPQIIIFGDQSYRDDTEMDSKMFMERLRSSPALPKTAAPPPQLYCPFYEEFSAKGDTMIVLCPSSDISGTTRSASVAAKDFPDADIRVIDTRTVGAGLGSMVYQTLEWVKQGLDADTIVEKVIEMGKRNRIYFYVDTLEYLFKGGRIGGAQALMGSLLQVKPLLIFHDGHIDSFESLRTKKRAQARLREIVMKECPSDPSSNLAIMHAEVEEEALIFANDFKNVFSFTNIPIVELPPAIIVHAGPGTVAISFFIEK